MANHVHLPLFQLLPNRDNKRSPQFTNSTWPFFEENRLKLRNIEFGSPYVPECTQNILEVANLWGKCSTGMNDLTRKEDSSCH